MEAARIKTTIIPNIIDATMVTVNTAGVIRWEPLPVGVGSSGRDEGMIRTVEGGRMLLVESGDSWVGEGSTWLVAVAEEVCGVMGGKSDESDVPYELLVMAAGVGVRRVGMGKVVVGGGGSGLAAGKVLKKATCGLSRILRTAPRHWMGSAMV